MMNSKGQWWIQRGWIVMLRFLFRDGAPMLWILMLPIKFGGCLHMSTMCVSLLLHPGNMVEHCTSCGSSTPVYILSCQRRLFYKNFSSMFHSMITNGICAFPSRDHYFSSLSCHIAWVSSFQARHMQESILHCYCQFRSIIGKGHSLLCNDLNYLDAHLVQHARSVPDILLRARPL